MQIESIRNSCIFLTDDLQTKMQKLKAENYQMQEQFNVQRAKMKELFLQKEGLGQFILLMGKRNY